MSDQEKSETKNKQAANNAEKAATNTGNTPTAPSTEPLPMLIPPKEETRPPPSLLDDVIELEYGTDGKLYPKLQ